MFKNELANYGQHFLIDYNVEKRLISEAHLSKDDVVVEIGPGQGNITSLMAPLVNQVIAIEKDERLNIFLDKVATQYHNVEIIYGNALNIYIPQCTKVITSLPYNIVEPFIEKMIRCHITEIIMIVGDTYAENVCTFNKTKLSLLTNSFYKCDKIMEIMPEAFNPRPRVKSALIHLQAIKSEDLIDNYALFLYREIFFNRTKKIKNAIIDGLIRYYQIQGKCLTQKESKCILAEMGIAQELLEKNIENCNNDEIIKIYEQIEKK